VVFNYYLFKLTKSIWIRTPREHAQKLTLNFEHGDCVCACASSGRDCHFSK